MTTIVLIEHNGNIKQTKSKDISRETLYKKCGFRNAEGFDKTTTWSVEYNKEMVNIELWAKTEGKANNENKYDFPPPVDNDLYFGSCALIRVDNKGGIINLTSELWVKVYDKLFGGFEELTNEDDEEEEEEEEEEDEEDEEEEEAEDEVVNVKNVKKNKRGVKKKDVVEDDAEAGASDAEAGASDADGSDEEADASEDDSVGIASQMKKKSVPVEEDMEEEDYYGSELEEEAYSYSDED